MMFTLLKNRSMLLFLNKLYSKSSPISHLVQHDIKLKEFSLKSDDEKAVLQYKELTPSTIDLAHTMVPKSLQGQDVGNVLVEAALEYALNQNLKVTASCTFVQHYLEKNPKPEFKKLLDT